MPNKTCILITGTHRSFTSLVANIFHNGLGVPMGKKFLPADPRNPKGYWEDMDFRDRNQEMVGRWEAPSLRATPTDQRFFDLLIRKRFMEHDVWGVKDVRFSHTLKVFADAFPHNAHLEIVVCQRDYNHSARSIELAMKVPFSSALAVVKKYDTALQRNLERIGLPKRWVSLFFLETTHLFSDTEAMVKALAYLAGVPYRADAVDIVDQSLKHF